MAAADHFDLVTDWHFAAPLERLWNEINRPEDWPQWWRAVRRVEPLTPGGPDGVGSVRRFTWLTALPYSFQLTITATAIEPMRRLEGRCTGDLEGRGIWTFTTEGAGTRVRYQWIVDLGKPWQRALAPVMRPVFTWNHQKVMAWGYAGLCRRLGVTPEPDLHT